MAECMKWWMLGLDDYYLLLPYYSVLRVSIYYSFSIMHAH